MTPMNPVDLNDPHTKWVVALAYAFKRAGASHSPIEPDTEVILQCINGTNKNLEVLAWLGFWRNHLPPEAISALQRIVMPESKDQGKLDCAPHERGNVPKFSVGQWVRHENTGQLVQVVSPGGPGWWSYRSQSGDADCPEMTLSPALPRDGEWWVYREDCDHHHHSWDLRRCRLFRWTPEDSMVCAGDYVQCGCLVPVNFGLGEAPHHETSEK